MDFSCPTEKVGHETPMIRRIVDLSFASQISVFSIVEGVNGLIGKIILRSLVMLSSPFLDNKAKRNNNDYN